MVMIILLNYFIRVTNFNKFTSLEYTGYTEVYKTVEYDDYQKIYIKTKQGKLFFNCSEKIYKSGMIIYIDGTIELPFKSHYENGFNYYEYLKYNSIYGKINTNEIYIIKKKFSFSNIHEGLNDYINNKQEYIMIAELNAKMPNLTMSLDAPGDNLAPHFDEHSNEDNFILHMPAMWDF
jgi:hypothetical protein